MAMSAIGLVCGTEALPNLVMTYRGPSRDPPPTVNMALVVGGVKPVGGVDVSVTPGGGSNIIEVRRGGRNP